MDYFLVGLFEQTATIKVHSESGKIRENRVRKPYGWDGIELETRVFIKDSRTDRNGLTSGSPFKYQLIKRETTMNIPARKDAFEVSSSGMAQRSGW